MIMPTLAVATDRCTVVSGIGAVVAVALNSVTTGGDTVTDAVTTGGNTVPRNGDGTGHADAMVRTPRSGCAVTPMSVLPDMTNHPPGGSGRY